MTYTTPETDMLNELVKAHQIIKNALNLMDDKQKIAWGKANEADGCDDDGAITRAHKREEAISRGKQYLGK
jgi:hypothetical protein